MRKLVAAVAVAALAALGTVNVASAAPAKAPPKSCIRALDSAERVATISGDFATIMQDFFQEVQESAQASSSGSSGAVLDFLTTLKTSIETVTTKMTPLNARLTSEVTVYKTNAASCRRGK